MTDSVLVLGSGIVGLTVAVSLAEAGWDIHIRTAEPPAGTTSATAGAIWGPWFAEPWDRAIEWAKASLAELDRLAVQGPAPGVRLVTGKEVSQSATSAPAWAKLLSDWRTCAPSELPAGYSYGTRYTAPIVTMPVHLAYLVERLHRAGGHIEIAPVEDLTELCSHTSIVINCTGVGARRLVDDELLYPVRGQQLIVTNPGITEFIEVDTGDATDLTAIYPHVDHLVLSGTAEPHEWDRTADPSTAERILQRCIDIEPRVANASILEHRVGTRPQRPQVRLEVQQTPGGILIHNYGHGGAGVSLAWGCAQEVARELHRSHGAPNRRLAP
jgi:D-amino-acid oxidase